MMLRVVIINIVFYTIMVSEITIDFFFVVSTVYYQTSP